LSFVVAGPADEAVLAEFMRQLREDDPEEGAFDEARSRPALRRLLVDPSVGRAWLLRLDGQSVGYVVLTFGFSLEYGGRDAFIDELFVARRFRGRGVGTKTLELVIDEARKLDAAILLLEVTQSNDHAKRLYRKVGFADRGHHLMTLPPT
jgi:ribosomal protein S18 acetylase RimI-like enzyme